MTFIRFKGLTKHFKVYYGFNLNFGQTLNTKIQFSSWQLFYLLKTIQQ